MKYVIESHMNNNKNSTVFGCRLITDYHETA